MIKNLLIPKGELLFDAQMYFSVDKPKELADCTNANLIEVTGPLMKH